MRTEEQKVMKAPIDVTFGDAKYQVKPLTLLKSQLWRTKLNEVMGPIADEFQSTKGLVSSGLSAALLKFPDKALELVFAYAPDLPQDVIREQATDEQMSEAFCEILIVAYPYLAPLAMVTRLIRPTESR